MDNYLLDLAHAGEARLEHGDRAGQHLVDTVQAALRCGDEPRATQADRALRIIASCGAGLTPFY